jgi:tRNA modification GTPase
MAQPGEFTRIAFLNGRMDLSQVEAVADLIHAKTDAARRASSAQLMGRLADDVQALRKQLIDVCSLVEIELDFAEENLINVERERVCASLDMVSEEIERLLSTYNTGRILRDGVRVAIIGKPNVGKSSLLNALLKRERAIVSEIPGTTRDYIEEMLDIRGIPVVILDTAGLRHTRDHVENVGVGYAKRLSQDCDLVLAVVDASTGVDNEDLEMLTMISASSTRPCVVVANKIDIGSKLDSSDVNGYPVVQISARTGAGLEEMKDTVFATLCGNVSFEAPMISTLRHKLSLQQSMESIRRARNSVVDGMSLEFAAIDIREASNALGEIVGEVTSDEVLDSIFANFCIGK